MGMYEKQIFVMLYLLCYTKNAKEVNKHEKKET